MASLDFNICTWTLVILACTSLSELSHIECNPPEFYECKEVFKCIPVSFVCDGEEDCSDASDEKNCEPLKNSSVCEDFHCLDESECLPWSFVCDGRPNCKDKSDEYGCDLIDNFCEDSFQCNSTECVPHEWVCDGMKDCKDNSDETHCSSKTQKAEGCHVFGACDQICIERGSTYDCECVKGYTLQSDNKTCIADGGEGLLMFETKTEIRGYLMGSKEMYSVAKSNFHISGVSYDGEEYYWSSLPGQFIKRTRDHDQEEVVLDAGLGEPNHIAIDLVTYNIYFTDALFNRIAVCTQNGTACSVLRNDIRRPKGLALHPEKGFMYWSDWGAVYPMIARSGMDGSEFVPFVTEEIEKPEGLTVDHVTNTLFWIDSKSGDISCINLQNRDRKLITSSPSHNSNSIAVFENNLFWSDWNAQAIIMANKFNGKNQTRIVTNKRSRIFGIQTYHPSVVDHASPCEKAKCSHMCVLAPTIKGFSCVCPQNTIQVEGDTCKERPEMLYLVFNSKIIRLDFGIIGNNTRLNTISMDVKEVGAMAHDFNRKTIFIFDSARRKIYSLDLSSETKRVLVDSKLGNVGGMDFDWYGNNLYWVDEDYRTVEVLSLTTMSRTTLFKDFKFLETPTDIALAPEHGCMFIAVQTKDGAHIEKLLMNGDLFSTKRFAEDMGRDVRIYFDPHSDKIIMANPTQKKLTSSDVNAEDKLMYLYTSPWPESFTVFDGYFVGVHDRSIDFLSLKGSGVGEFSIYPNSPSLSGAQLLSFNYQTSETTHVCQENNGRCSHLCLLKGSKSRLCSCPNHMKLDDDGRNCKIKQCTKDEFKCGSGRCTPRRTVCDGVFDCEDKSDEQHCDHTCDPKSSFLCGDGFCIPETWKCDGHPECKDHSDEADELCKKPVKTCSGYQCRSSEVCIAPVLRCNKKKDCPHGDDEEGCCASDEFQCKPGECIAKEMTCDLTRDCTNGADEAFELCKSTMWQSNLSTTEPKCEGFKCQSNGKCIEMSLVCDNKPDCEDESDEHGLCVKDCKMVGCSHTCHDTPKGGVCFCPTGYHLDNDNKTCIDLNECLDSAVCSQFCINTYGSFKCECKEPYYSLREDGMTCKATDSSTEYHIVTDENIYSSNELFDSRIPIFTFVDGDDYAQRVSGLDLNVKKRELYWTSEIQGTLIIMFLDDLGQYSVVRNLTRPSKISFDWINDLVYIVEKGNRVSACNTVFTKCALITHSEDTLIRALAVDPLSGFMFWVETSYFTIKKPKSVVLSSDLSGNNKMSVISEDVYIVPEISLDIIKKHLYWIDSSQKRIERSNYDGTQRTVIHELENDPVDLTYFEGYIYWVNGVRSHGEANRHRGEGIIGKCNLYAHAYFDCEKKIALQSDGKDIEIQKLRILHPALQIEGSSDCPDKECEYLCVGGRNGPVCLTGHEGSELSGRKSVFLPPLKGMNNEDRNSTSHDALWGILMLIGVGGSVAYLIYRFVPLRQCLPKKLENISITFQNPVYDIEVPSPSYHHSQLTPGEHEYENIVTSLETEPKAHIQFANEMTRYDGEDYDDLDLEEEILDSKTIKDRSPLI